MLKNGFYNVIAGLFRAGLSFVSIPILIHLMGVEEYGVWALVSSVLGFVTVAEVGLPVSATVFVSQDLARKDKKGLSETLTVTVGGILLLATTGALLLFIGSGILVQWFPKLETLQQQTVTQSLKIGSIALWAQLVQQVFIGVEQAYQQYKLMSVLNTLQWVICILGWMILAWSGGKTLALAQWQAVTSVGSLLGHFTIVGYLINPQTIKPMWNTNRGIEIARYSFVSWVTTLGRAIFMKGDRLIVGSILGANKLAIYATFFEISGAINLFSALIIQPLIPTISYLINEPNVDQSILKNQVKKAFNINCIVSIFLGILLLLFAPTIVKSIIPAAFSKANIYNFRTAIFINTLVSLNATGYWILFGIKAVNQSALIQISFGILTLILINIGATHLGLWGATIGNFGYIGTLILPIIALKKINISASLLLSWLKLPILLFLVISLLSITIFI
ncbi:MAG: oligosaccharide flippase family protein [Goleter apudmare HA4340-LM2]|jgi:O-antigen/teichoic acid export membrane protein|nr:oligosaccharide flippase family protein [Goleter apudmare HA4340-LM2]